LANDEDEDNNDQHQCDVLSLLQVAASSCRRGPRYPLLLLLLLLLMMTRMTRMPERTSEKAASPCQRDEPNAGMCINGHRTSRVRSGRLAAAAVWCRCYATSK